MLDKLTQNLTLIRANYIRIIKIFGTFLTINKLISLANKYSQSNIILTLIY